MDGDEVVLAEEDVQLAQLQIVVGADQLGLVEDDEVVAGVLLDLRALVRVAAVLDGERVEAELLGQLVEVLARRVGDVRPDDVVLDPTAVAQLRGREVLRELL